MRHATLLGSGTLFLIVMLGHATAFGQERVAPSRPPAAPPSNTAKQIGVQGAAPVNLGCQVKSTSAAVGFTQIVATNTSGATIPAGRRIKWTVNYDMTSLGAAGPDGKPKVSLIPGTSSDEIVLTEPFAAGKSLTVKSSKSQDGVGYKDCAAFAGP